MSPNSGGKDLELNEGGKGKKKAKETRKRGRKRLEEDVDATAGQFQSLFIGVEPCPFFADFSRV